MLLFITSIFIIFSIEIDRISASPSPIAGRPPEDINCPYPNYGIYGNALFSKASSVEWEQKKAFWLTLDIPSRTIVDCMQQCYQYKFCYSIRFLKNAKKSCRLFLHSSDDCKRKLLLSAKKIDQRLEELKADRVIVECLKCMKDEVGIATMSNSEDVPKKTGKGKSPELRLATDDQKDQFLQNDEPIRNSAEAVTRTVKTEPTTDDQREQRQIWRACLVTFEVLPESQKEKALRGINLAKTASVTSLNECAFICYQNACSNILFELSESEEIPSKCHLDIESNKETCSPNLQRHYSYPNNNGTMISCVRCVAHKPTTISPDAEFIPEKTIFTKDNLSFTASTPFSPTILREEPSAETTISEMNNTTPEIRAETDEVTHLIQTIGEAEKKEEDKSSATTTEAPAIEEKIPLLPIIIVNEHEEDGDSTQRPKSVGLAIPSREKSTESTDKPETNESEENTGFTILVQLKNESEVGKMFEGESSQTTEEVDQEQKGIFVGENGGTTAEIEMAVSVSQNEDFGSTTSSSSLISMDSIGLGEASESGLSITTTRIEESMGVETASNGIESKSTPSVSNAVVIAQVMTSSSSPATLSTEPEKTSTIESEKTITSYLSIAGPTPISLNLTGIQEVIVTSTASKTKDEENISNDQTSLSATNAAQFGKSAESITTSPADETTGQVEASASSSAKESGLSPASSNTAKLDEAAGSSSTTSKEATTEIEAISSSIPAESGSSPASPIVVEHEETVGFKRTPSATTQVEATSSSSPAENWSSTAPPADDTTIEFGESSAPLIIAGMQEADAKNANSTSAETTTEVISPSNPAEIGSSPAPPIVIEHEETAGSSSTTSKEATTEVEATSSSSPAESGSSTAPPAEGTTIEFGESSAPLVIAEMQEADAKNVNTTSTFAEGTTEVEPTSSSSPAESGSSQASPIIVEHEETAGSGSTTSTEATTEVEAISSSSPAESGSSPASPILIGHEETAGSVSTSSTEATTEVEAISSSSPAESGSSTAPPAEGTTIEFGESSAPLVIAGMQEADAKNVNTTSTFAEGTTEVEPTSSSSPAESGSSPAPPIVIENEETAGSSSTTSTEVEATSSIPAESGSSPAPPNVIENEETAGSRSTTSTETTTEIEATSSSSPAESGSSTAPPAEGTTIDFGESSAPLVIAGMQEADAKNVNTTSTFAEGTTEVEPTSSSSPAESGSSQASPTVVQHEETADFNRTPSATTEVEATSSSSPAESGSSPAPPTVEHEETAGSSSTTSTETTKEVEATSSSSPAESGSSTAPPAEGTTIDFGESSAPLVIAGMQEADAKNVNTTSTFAKGTTEVEPTSSSSPAESGSSQASPTVVQHEETAGFNRTPSATTEVEARSSSSPAESGSSPASPILIEHEETAGSSSTTSKEATTEIEATSSSIPAESVSSPASPIVVEHEETVGFNRTPSATTQVEATSSSSPAESGSSTAPPADDTTIEFGESSAPLIIAGMQEADAKNANSTSAETTEVISPSNPAEIGSSPAPPIVIEHEETAGSGSTTSTEATTEVEATSSSSPAESGSSQASPIVVQHEETADFNPTPSATTEVEPTSSSNPSEESQDLINAVSNIVDIVKLHSTTTTEHAITTVSDIIDFIEHNISIGDIRQHNPPGFEMRECHGEMLFAGNVLMDYTQSFEIILASETVYECVITCFQLNCTQAAFTHFPRSACLMRFNSNQMPLNSKCSESEELISSWNFKKVPEVVMITCIKCQKEEHLDRGTERILHDELSLDNFRRILDTPHHIINPQGITTKCTGRVEFVIHPVSNLHNLNITNDLPADTPADCARKCFELESCSMAGFIPTPGHESAGGICLITTNFHHNNNCSHNARYTPQYASTLPFLIECIRCTECNYTLSLVDSERATFEYEQSLPVRTISECAKKCSANKCSLAQFDPNKSICSFTASNEIENCQIEAGIQTDGIFPVLLNCVKCVK